MFILRSRSKEPMPYNDRCNVSSNNMSTPMIRRRRCRYCFHNLTQQICFVMLIIVSLIYIVGAQSSSSLVAVARPNQAAVEYRHYVAPRDKNAIDLNPVHDDADDVGDSVLSTSTDSVITKFNRAGNGDVMASINRLKPSELPIRTSKSSSDGKLQTPRSNTATPCYPENDGYFGATFGSPITLQYGLEIRYHQDINSNDKDNLVSALAATSNLIVRALIADTFPSICGDGNNNDGEASNSNRTFTAGRILGLKFEKELKLDVSEPCENVSEGLDCGVYLGYLAVYGRALSDATSNFVFKSIASTINNAVLSRVSKFGIVHVSDLEKFSTQVDEGTNQQLEDSASSITSDKPLSVGAKFGFGVAAAGLGTFVLIVLMYVRLDIQSRRAKLSTRYGSEHNRCNTYLSPVKEARIVANKPRSSPETWGAFGILRSHTARTDACDSTQFDMDGGFGDESYNMISLETSTIPGSSRLGSRTCQSHLSSHDGIIREASTKPSIVLEFGPGFNPPLGRPEAKNQSEGEEESGEIDDDEFDDDFHGRENDDDDRDLERYDSASIYSSSVAEFSNIDDQIFESDRRRRSRSVGAASTSQRRNRRSHRAHKFR